MEPKSDTGDKAASRAPVRLLVSKCLLGEKVRYDGQHKYDPFVVEMLGRFVEWERVCPEADSGMSTPRPSMRLVGDPTAPRLISRTGQDLTGRMASFSSGASKSWNRSSCAATSARRTRPAPA